MSKKATYTEIETSWTRERVLQMNAILDMQDDYEKWSEVKYKYEAKK